MNLEIAALSLAAVKHAPCHFVVHGDPIPKGRARVARTSKSVRVYTPQRTVEYEKLIGYKALETRPASWNQAWASYAVHLRVYEAERRSDADNIFKAVADGTQGILWANDKRIRSLTVELFDDLARPRIEVYAEMVGQYDEEQAAKVRARLMQQRRTAARRTA